MLGGFPEERIFLTGSGRDHEGCADIILREAEPEELILFKGSRGMELERVIDLLTSRIGEGKNHA